jgi:Domain of unknown function (DUF4911)
MLMLGENMERTKRIRMRRDALGFFKAILESYEEVALLTVLDGDKGEAEIIYPSSSEETLELIMEDMARYDILFQEVDHAE